MTASKLCGWPLQPMATTQLISSVGVAAREEEQHGAEGAFRL